MTYRPDRFDRRGRASEALQSSRTFRHKEISMPKPTANKTQCHSQGSAGPRSGSRKTTGSKRAVSKLDTIENMLRRPKGVSIDDLTKVTGWQAHSVRAALTRLRKKDIVIVREVVRGNSRYQIATQ